jgi:hypothetical protein
VQDHGATQMERLSATERDLLVRTVHDRMISSIPFVGMLRAAS